MLSDYFLEPSLIPMQIFSKDLILDPRTFPDRISIDLLRMMESNLAVAQPVEAEPNRQNSFKKL